MKKAARARRNREKGVKGGDGADATTMVAEPSGSYRNESSDLLDLLLEAEQAGLSPDRVQKLRVRLERGPAMLPGRIAELERSVRNWLYRREHVTGSRLLP
jgi:hypothetical protein